MPRLLLIALVVSGLLHTRVATQGAEQVVPASATLDGANVSPRVFGPDEVRTQVLIDSSLLGNIQRKSIRRIAFRRDVQKNETLPLGWKSGWVDLQILASWSAANPLRPADDFATNRGPVALEVFRGAYHVIASPQLPKNTTVAPFTATVSPEVPLQRPIPPGTGTLCLEIVTRNDTTRAPPMHWLVDVFEANHPRTTYGGASCWRPGFSEKRAAGVIGGAPGGMLTCLANGPSECPALIVVGFSATRWSIFALPLDLTVIGAPGCKLQASLDVTLAAALRRHPGGTSPKGHVQLMLPGGIAGLELHTQWIFFDPPANALGLTMTNRASVRVATPAPGMLFATIQSVGADERAGEVRVSSMPVLKLFDQ